MYIHGGAEVVRNLIHATVRLRSRVVPGSEHRLDGHPQLLTRILGEILARLLPDQLLVAGNNLLQILGSQLRIQFRFAPLFLTLEEMVEFLLRNLHHHVAEHLNEAAVAVESPARVPGLLGKRFRDLIVHSQVQNRIHHAGHGKLGARTHADK